MPKDKKDKETPGREGQRPNSPKNFDEKIDQKQGKRELKESDGDEFSSGPKGQP